jgi:methionyl-tRNA synthetase
MSKLGKQLIASLTELRDGLKNEGPEYLKRLKTSVYRRLEDGTIMAENTTAAPVKPTVTFADFEKLDLRVCKVMSAKNHPNADRLLILEVDDGSGTPRTIVAGIRGRYSAEEIVGRQIIVVVNLEPREMRGGVVSSGMLLAASETTPTGTRNVSLLNTDLGMTPGARVG